MKAELSRQELALLLAWAEEATKGKFGIGDSEPALSWEEQQLLEKLRAWIQQS